MKTITKVRAIIHGAASAAAAVGAGLAQIPVADAVVLAPIQTTMIIAVAAQHGARITKSVAMSLLAPFAAVYAGRAASQALIGWIPALGNIVDASTAFALTEAIGWAAHKYFEKFSKLGPIDRLVYCIEITHHDKASHMCMQRCSSLAFAAFRGRFLGGQRCSGGRHEGWPLLICSL